MIMAKPNNKLALLFLATLLTLGVSSLAFKAVTVQPVTSPPLITKASLTDFMFHHGFHYINSWAVINNATYRATKFTPSSQYKNCADGIIVIDMSGDATLVAMLEAGVDKNSEALHYLYRGNLYQPYPTFRVWFDNYWLQIKRLIGSPSSSQSILGIFSSSDCTPITTMPWHELRTSADSSAALIFSK